MGSGFKPAAVLTDGAVLITYPLSVQLQGLAGVKAVRSSSEFNFSMINIIFDEKTDFYFARTRVLERLGVAGASLPAGVTPFLAPDATALGQIFWYTIDGDGKGLDELRAIQDYTVRYALNSIPGVAEVAVIAGLADAHIATAPHARARPARPTCRGRARRRAAGCPWRS